jgi:hypothetical protein
LVPKVRVLGFFFEFSELSFFVSEVKDAPAGGGCVPGSPQAGLINLP